MPLDLIVGGIAVLLTLAVLSRVFGDNPIFRATQYLFVGASLGYAFLVVYFQILRPATLNALANSNNLPLLLVQATPLLLSLLLLPRALGRQTGSWLANLPLALLFGATAALTFGGALVGTLLPQLVDIVSLRPGPIGMVMSVAIALVVILILASFRFTWPNASPPEAANPSRAARLGRGLLTVAFGFFFAGAITTYITALNDRLNVVVTWFAALFGVAAGS